ncbi:hypothetical protein ACNKHO_05530 [Shigella flexneri]
MIVVIDGHTTSSAEGGQILLPDCTASEQMDFALDALRQHVLCHLYRSGYLLCFECKTIYDMTTSLVKRMA